MRQILHISDINYGHHRLICDDHLYTKNGHRPFLMIMRRNRSDNQWTCTATQHHKSGYRPIQ